jgi:hypothetical protein
VACSLSHGSQALINIFGCLPFWVTETAQVRLRYGSGDSRVLALIGLLTLCPCRRHCPPLPFLFLSSSSHLSLPSLLLYFLFITSANREQASSFSSPLPVTVLSSLTMCSFATILAALSVPLYAFAAHHGNHACRHSDLALRTRGDIQKRDFGGLFTYYDITVPVCSSALPHILCFITSTE